MMSKGRLSEIVLGIILLLVTYTNFKTTFGLASIPEVRPYIKFISLLSPLSGFLASVLILNKGFRDKDQTIKLKALLLGAGILTIIFSVIINMIAVTIAGMQVAG
jgi:hypothetical protein